MTERMADPFTKVRKGWTGIGLDNIMTITDIETMVSLPVSMEQCVKPK